ncbi:unnamed protein product, partial [Choristocarpus tenellus]
MASVHRRYGRRLVADARKLKLIANTLRNAHGSETNGLSTPDSIARAIFSVRYLCQKKLRLAVNGRRRKDGTRIVKALDILMLLYQDLVKLKKDC